MFATASGQPEKQWTADALFNMLKGPIAAREQPDIDRLIIKTFRSGVREAGAVASSLCASTMVFYSGMSLNAYPISG
jgi:hypothetical protein